ncbi:TIGR00266 family protein [Vibrio crassostreae]|uniref:TIGR00266 family protein n=1 Tax=Vibrio crassostreae TaxID=246167 RepID=UPI001B303A94|nr:TIGR00266 family protein [Vibrio crassostreae]
MNKSDVIDYEILGDSLQMVVVELDPEETVIAEAGVMQYMEHGIEFETRMGDGSEADKGFLSKLGGAAKRSFTGESLFMTHFTNHDETQKRKVAFSAPFTGKIVPFDLSKLGGEIICQKDAFLCAAKGTKLSIHFNKKFGAGLFGGEGFIMQKLEGDGMAFVHAGGHIQRVELKEGEPLRIDTGALVAMTSGVDIDIKRAGGLKTMAFGGEGLFLTTLSGSGTVWLQSLPFSNLADSIIAHAPSVGGESQGSGSILGKIFRMFVD